jgi:hypothetical protein
MRGFYWGAGWVRNQVWKKKKGLPVCTPKKNGLTPKRYCVWMCTPTFLVCTMVYVLQLNWSQGPCTPISILEQCTGGHSNDFGVYERIWKLKVSFLHKFNIFINKIQ